MANNVKVGTLYYELNAGGNLLDILNKSKKGTAYGNMA